MTTEWIELKIGKEVFDRAAEGWEIEVNADDENAWERWMGKAWIYWKAYRGRPPQPKTKVVTSECWRNKGGSIHYGDQPNINWQRFPAGDITGEVRDD